MQPQLLFYFGLAPAAAGFSLFGAGHLLMLCVAFGAVAALCFGYRRAAPAARQRLRLVLVGGMLLLELGKDAVLAAMGLWNLSFLPLHLCGLAVFVCLADALQPTDATAQILYALCLPGALGALLFPDWASYPLFGAFSQQGFWLHALLLAYPLARLTAGELIPQARSLWKCGVFLVCTALPLSFLNRLWGTNFMFLNKPSVGSPLEWFAAALGSPGYLLGYAALLAAVWTALYLPWSLPCSHQSGQR